MYFEDLPGTQVTIKDIAGRSIAAFSNYTSNGSFDISNLEAGVYFLSSSELIPFRKIFIKE